MVETLLPSGSSRTAPRPQPPGSKPGRHTRCQRPAPVAWRRGSAYTDECQRTLLVIPVDKEWTQVLTRVRLEPMQQRTEERGVERAAGALARLHLIRRVFNLRDDSAEICVRMREVELSTIQPVKRLCQQENVMCHRLP